jgi:hypothetical protein
MLGCQDQLSQALQCYFLFCFFRGSTLHHLTITKFKQGGRDYPRTERRTSSVQKPNPASTEQN